MSGGDGGRRAAAGPAPFARADFAVPAFYLDSASRHPLPVAAAARLHAYADFLTRHDRPQGLTARQDDVRRLFAALINAEPDEISLVPSTLFAENLILQALGLPCAGRGIVTDALHYADAVTMYRSLAAEGHDVAILPLCDGAPDYDRLADAVTPATALVAVSGVSHFNGAGHDLRQVCEIAHASGALVYADMIQQAGALPIDVRASGVDICACGTYKWLLGDMGVAFLYVRRDRWPLLARPVRGCVQTADPLPNASGFFHIGTLGSSGIEILSETLPQTITAMAAADAGDRWRPLAARIDDRLAEAGLAPLTPRGSASSIRAFGGARLDRARIEAIHRSGVRVTAREGYMRLAPAVFNSRDEVEKALDIIVRHLR